MPFRDARTPPHRSTGLDPDAADDILGDDMAGADDLDDMGDRVDDTEDGGPGDSDLDTPRPDGLDEGLGTDNATGSNATL